MTKLERLSFGSLALWILGCSSTPPKLGVVDGKLTPCDNPSHCVSSQSPDPQSKVEPLTYADPLAQAKVRLRAILEDFSRMTLTEETADYWRVEFRSFLFRFVDDVEFLFRTPGKVDVRSGARVGDTDFGVNRKRVEKIRAAFETTAKK